MFEYIELFYNPKRTRTNNGMLSPVGFEIRHQKLNQAGVQETRGTSLRHALSPAKLCNAVLALQAIQDDPDLFFR